MVWDDLKRRVTFEIGLPSQVLSIRWRKDKLATHLTNQRPTVLIFVHMYMYMYIHVCTMLYRLIVVLANAIHVFYFPTSPSLDSSPSPYHLSTITTSCNTRGLCEVHFVHVHCTCTCMCICGYWMLPRRTC